MVQFYEVYSSTSFKNLLQTTKLVQFTKLELPSKAKDFVPFETAQIPTILFSTGWTNHQIFCGRSSQVASSQPTRRCTFATMQISYKE